MINLNYRDSAPIYEQIKENFKKLIASGIMAKGEKMPSVRSLAGELAINPNTIQRAYSELEAEGFIYSIAGKGSFVNGVPEIDDETKRELFNKLIINYRKLRYMGVSKNEIAEVIEKEGNI